MSHHDNDTCVISDAYSHINQQIATKTISKLGFQASAVWNGKEALDYLLGAQQGTNPKPDIILMDVQMPIIDGYKCTHLLRHHLPFKNYVQDVPIVAMTASAIQGDREKCNRAGMDDYLAKPVRSGILEKMLMRWCYLRRRTSTSPSQTASDCSEMSEYCDNAGIPQVGVDDSEAQSVDHNAEDPGSPITPRPLPLNGQQEPSPFDAPEFGVSSQVRQPEGEQELSNILQETKLIDAAGGPAGGPAVYRSNSYQESLSKDSLTEENIQKLKNESHPPRQ